MAAAGGAARLPFGLARFAGAERAGLAVRLGRDGFVLVVASHSGAVRMETIVQNMSAITECYITLAFEGSAFRPGQAQAQAPAQRLAWGRA